MQSITCHQAVDYLSKEEENLLSTTQQAQLQEHLQSCSLCRHFQHQTRLITTAFGKTPDNKLSPDDLEALSAALKSA